MSVVNYCLIFVEGSTDKTVRAPSTRRSCAAPCAERARAVSCQVVASLSVSLVLMGFKLSALKRLVQLSQRRTELKADLQLLQPKVEEEALVVFLDDLHHDATQRQARIAEMALPSGLVYSTMENHAVARCLGMFEMFDSNLVGATPLNRSASMVRLETKFDEATRLLLGFADAEIRADPLLIVAYCLNADGRCVSTPHRNRIRYEVFHINAHHTVTFVRYKAPGIRDRTFLVSAIAKQVADDPPTFVVAVVPIPSHDKIGPKDEAGAVRAENCRIFRITAVAPGVSNVEYACTLDLRGRVPRFVTNMIAVPAQRV
jgi:hypothetical protein